MMGQCLGLTTSYSVSRAVSVIMLMYRYSLSVKMDSQVSYGRCAKLDPAGFKST